jgi:hypothetical protein
LVLLASATDLLSQSPEQPQPPAAPHAFDQYEAPRRPGLATKIRSAIPVLSFDSPEYASTSNGSPPPPYGTEFWLLDLSLSFEFGERLDVEAGGSLAIGEVGGLVGYFRAGPLANLHRGQAWTVNFQPLLGAEYRGLSSTLMAAPMVAIDATRWWPNGWGLTFRVRAGYDFRLASWGSKTTAIYGGTEGMATYYSDDIQSAVEFGVDLGVAARR